MPAACGAGLYSSFLIGNQTPSQQPSVCLRSLSTHEGSTCKLHVEFQTMFVMLWQCFVVFCVASGSHVFGNLLAAHNHLGLRSAAL